MGSIIWQLNDVWPCPSWSSVEYGGQWKLLQYESQKFFDIVSIPCFIKDNKYFVYISNDTLETLQAEIEVQFIDFTGKKYKDSIVKNVLVNADVTESFVEIEIDKKDVNNYFIYTNVSLTSTSKKKYNLTNTTFPGLYKHCDLQQPNIKYAVYKEENRFRIELNSENPAFFVSLDTKTTKGRFSTNMFTILPGKTETVFYYPEKEISLDDIKSELVINDLRKTYK